MSCMRYNLKRILLWSGFAVAILGCKKKDKVFDDPYAGAKAPLGIKLSTDPPSPGTGGAGSVVTFKASGLLPYKDSLHFYLNNEPAEVVSVDEGSIQVKVPPT